MSNNITVNSGETLTKIVKREYGLTNNTDIMNAVNLIKNENKLKNVNLITVGQQKLIDYAETLKPMENLKTIQ